MSARHTIPVLPAAAAAELPVKLSDELSHVQEMPLDRDYYEDHGFMILARTSDHDLLLWTSSNIIRGVGAGQWVVPDGRVPCTELIAIPRDGPGKGLFNNNFIRDGWHLPLYQGPEALQVTQESDRVIWTFGDRRTICRPPTWEVQGRHAGVELDLVCEKMAPAIWQWGPFEQARQNDHAGYELFVTARGTITAGGRTHVIENGLGVHEHAVLGQSWDIIPELVNGAEFYWLLCLNNDIQTFLMRHTGRGIDYGQARVEGEDIRYMPSRGLGTINFHTLDRWYDPRSGLNVPSKWHLEMTSDQGTLDLHIDGRGRGYYHYTVKKGVLIMMWILAVAKGDFRFPDGRRLPIKETLVCIEWGQAILAAHEGPDGPED